MKVLIAGETDSHSLEFSYSEALRSLGHEVNLFDTKRTILSYARPAKWAFQLHRFFPVQAWVRKANKELIHVCASTRPDILIVFSGAEVLPGTIAYIKGIFPTKIIWYWADPLVSLSPHVYNSFPLTDLVASYSETSLDSLAGLGARKTAWIPFAGDPGAHYLQAAKTEEYRYGLSFVGSWRPEREMALKTIKEHFPQLKLKICGPYWNRAAYAPIRRLAEARPIYGKAFSEIVRHSFLNLNVMDDGNYPAVNMRFFEILTAGGMQLCSAAPEMERIFIHRQHVLYFSGTAQLLDQIDYALDQKPAIESMKINAQELLLADHVYAKRAASLLRLLD